MKIVDEYGAWLTETPIPKLFIDADPGALMNARAREFCRKWPNQREVCVKGIHFVQEDSPHAIDCHLAESVGGALPIGPCRLGSGRFGNAHHEPIADVTPFPGPCPP